MKKHIIPLALSCVTVLASLGSCGSTAKSPSEVSEVVIEKSTGGNPIIDMYDEDGNIIYGGDPAVYVDGDTVYLYTGHDISTDKEVSEKTYHIPEYLCYSSTDLINWKNEGVVLNMHDVDWTRNSTSAWASQVIKYKDNYYLYYCSWDKKARGKQSIGVAVSSSPTGPFVDKGESLVNGLITKPESNAWNDIDPTVWVETDESGEEHRYLAWGNSLFYVCELNEDMISVKDLNGDGDITFGIKEGSGDIYSPMKGLGTFTEAPWLYRRQDENGSYYGDYYLFYASQWRESMAYAHTDDLMFGEWQDYTIYMPPTATCNTNHEAIFDFKGKTYIMYHNGARPGGNGYRRSACLQELVWTDDGRIEPVTESAAGLSGTVSTIAYYDGTEKDSTSLISHESFVCSSDDKDYPYVGISVGNLSVDSPLDSEWVIVSGKSDPSNDSLVSIQSENKVGLYLTVAEDGSVVLSQDVDGKEETALLQTFCTKEALNGKEDCISLESVSSPGMFISVDPDSGLLKLTDGTENQDMASFLISAD